MTVHPSIPATHDYYCKYTNKPSVMPNLFGITEREYIGRSQIYEEYSVKKIAKVDRRSVRVGEANFLSHIYEEYSVKKIAKVDRRSFPLSESLRSLTTLTTLKSLKPPRSACMRACIYSPPLQRLVNQDVSRSCRGCRKAIRAPLATIVPPATARRHVARQGIIYI